MKTQGLDMTESVLENKLFKNHTRNNKWMHGTIKREDNLLTSRGKPQIP